MFCCDVYFSTAQKTYNQQIGLKQFTCPKYLKLDTICKVNRVFGNNIFSDMYTLFVCKIDQNFVCLYIW